MGPHLPPVPVFPVAGVEVRAYVSITCFGSSCSKIGYCDALSSFRVFILISWFLVFEATCLWRITCLKYQCGEVQVVHPSHHLQLPTLTEVGLFVLNKVSSVLPFICSPVTVAVAVPAQLREEGKHEQFVNFCLQASGQYSIWWDNRASYCTYLVRCGKHDDLSVISRRGVAS